MKSLGVLEIIDAVGNAYHPSRLPIGFVTFCTTGLVVGYALAAFLQNDVSPIFPRISHTGNFPPASMVFSFNLGIAAIFLVQISFVVFKSMKRIINYHHQEVKSQLINNTGLDSSDALMENQLRQNRKHSINRLCLCCGILAAVGALGVGAFQVTYSKWLHYLFLVIMVVNGYTYSVLHTVNSRKFLKKMNYPKQDYLFRFRVSTLVTGGVGLIFMFTLTIIGAMKWDPLVSCTEDEKAQWQSFKNCSERNHNWKQGDGGFTHFVFSNVGQWIWLGSFFVFVFTTRNELKCKVPSIKMENIDEISQDGVDPIN